MKKNFPLTGIELTPPDLEADALSTELPSITCEY